jgi:hypothetical protein
MTKQPSHESTRSDAEKETRNRGLEQEEAQLRDPDKRAPRRAAEQDQPEPERVTTPQEKAESDVAHLENPPQTEGPRERSNESV